MLFSINPVANGNVTVAARLLFLLLASGPLAAAEKLPLWEVGPGLATFAQPHYLGADDSEVYAVPIPYFKYRGKVIRADRGGIRARLFESERLDLGFSGGGSFGVDSKDSETRRGMPDLDVLAEMGPNLRYKLVDNDSMLLQFQWPVRAAFSFGDKFGQYEGWTSNPRLTAKIPIGEWDYTTTFGPIFSDQNYHDYTYSVAPEFATAERAAYEADGGYTGLRMGLGASRYFKNGWTVNLFARYYDLHGAENRNSPLVRREHNFSAGIMVAWLFKRSKTMVEIDDEGL